jgi:HEAT repeat protein
MSGARSRLAPMSGVRSAFAVVAIALCAATRTASAVEAAPTCSPGCGCTDDAPFLRTPVARTPSAADYARLVAQTTDPSCEVAATAVRSLEMLGDHRAESTLIRLLEHRACRIRAAAAEALGAIGAHASVLPLIAALRDADARVRSGAAWSLARVGDPRAVPALVRTMRDTDSHVRQGAATALGRIGDARGADVLVQALRDPEKSVREAAAEALGRLRSRPSS